MCVCVCEGPTGARRVLFVLGSGRLESSLSEEGRAAKELCCAGAMGGSWGGLSAVFARTSSGPLNEAPAWRPSACCLWPAWAACWHAAHADRVCAARMIRRLSGGVREVLPAWPGVPSTLLSIAARPIVQRLAAQEETIARLRAELETARAAARSAARSAAAPDASAAAPAGSAAAVAAAAAAAKQAAADREAKFLAELLPKPRTNQDAGLSAAQQA